MKLLTPLGVLVALALAAGVWFQPLKGLRPEPPSPAPMRDPGEGTGSEPTTEEPNHDWVALAAPLQKLREPEKDRTEQSTETQAGEGEELPNDPTMPDPYPNVLRTWEYIGSIREPSGRYVAIISIDGRQRFIREQSVVPIPKLPDRPGFEVLSITEERITLRAEENDYTLDRKEPDPDPLESQTPSRVDRLNPDEDRR